MYSCEELACPFCGSHSCPSGPGDSTPEIESDKALRLVDGKWKQEFYFYVFLACCGATGPTADTPEAALEMFTVRADADSDHERRSER